MYVQSMYKYLNKIADTLYIGQKSNKKIMFTDSTHFAFMHGQRNRHWRLQRRLRFKEAR